MRTKSLQVAAGLALLAIGLPPPACAQFFYPIITVPPPSQIYGSPKPPKPPPPDKPKPPDPQQPPPRTYHYQGRTLVPD